MTAHTLPREMTAWRQSRYGSADVVAAETVPVPRPGKGEVLVRVRATSLNAADVHILRGEPALLRLAFGLRRPRQRVQGRDVCGTVVALGAEVTQWTVGDEVLGEIPGGGLAEFAVAPASRFVRRPESLDPAFAASLPLAGGTAVQALDAAGVVAGQRVLVIGAGGVGTFAVQLAAARGAEVWALCGRRAEAFVGTLGATRALDYREHPIGALEPGSFDAVIDTVGSASPARLQRLLRPGGSVILVGAAGVGPIDPFPRMLSAMVRSRRTRRIRPLAAVPRTSITTDLVERAAAGTLLPTIERSWPLAHAGDALAFAEAGHTVGKVVVVAG